MYQPYQNSHVDLKENGDQHDETSELVSGRKNIRAFRVSFRWALALSLLCCCCMWIVSTVTQFIHYWPTERERDIAETHGLTLTVETTKNIREAQRIADSFRAARLIDFDPRNKYARKITDDHGNTHYMPVSDGCEATVMIVRHCEKGDIREHCSYEGFERSVYLASLFGDNKNDRWPMPSYIFALSPSGRDNARKMNFREIETVEPLAAKAGVTIDDSYPVHRAVEMTNEILTFLQSGQMCGKLTVISWKHSEIAHLARKLGCGPFEGCPVSVLCVYQSESYLVFLSSPYTINRSWLHSFTAGLQRTHV
jgi:hypothetical protein